MNNIYMIFYNQQTRKVHQDEIGQISLDQYPFLTYQEPYYLLKPDILIGRIDHKKTFGFLRQEVEDIYIEEALLKDSMHDDIVLVEDGRFAKVVYIVKRALTTVIATVEKNKQSIRYFPETYIDRPLEVTNELQIVSGHVVRLNIDEISEKNILAHVVEIIGHQNDPDIETLKIVSAYQWPRFFAEEVLEDLKNLNIDFIKAKRDRIDLANKLIVTIDGEDAKDLDDAVSLTIKNDQYHLGVHIADVSLYVQEDSPLDQEAYKRATSSYLADRVIPMLPHLLSNDYCSLNPDELKLTLSCFMIFDAEANLVSYDINKTIIKSKKRLTYGSVNDLFNKNESTGDKTIDKMLFSMLELSQKLKIKRRKRGEIEFESSELGFKVDEQGRVLDVFERKTDQAEELIESFMLAANETVAEHMFHASYPSIYRIHETPDLDKLKQALTTISRLGVQVQMKQIGKAKPLQILTQKTAGTPLSYLIHMSLLRAMQKAKYSEQRSIHFGLGAQYYTHFTSPIRRYPDLILHRLIHCFVLGETNNFNKDFRRFESILPEVAIHTSNQERRAIQMERDVAKLKSCEYMNDKIGKKFNAMITQMMGSGMFVKLENGIEGYVPLRSLDDYYRYEEANLMFVGSRGKTYKLGQKIRVELLSVDLRDHQMDFGIVDAKKGNKYESNSTKQKGKTRLSRSRKA